MLHWDRKILLWGFLLLLLLFSDSLVAQSILAERDSLPFAKPKALQSRYIVNYPPLGEIRLVKREIRALEGEKENFWGRLTGGTITLLSGLQTSALSKGIWLSENELVSSDPNFSWQVPIFIQGEEFRNRQRVRNEDGSRSVETQTGVIMDWTYGAFGLILEGSDTLGRFTLLPDQLMDHSGFFWLSRLERDNKNLTALIGKYEPVQVNANFMAKVEFRSREITMVSSGRDYRSLILLEDQPIAVFQSEPHFIILNKKNRISPYLLVAKEMDKMEHGDLIRLSLLNTLLAQFLREESQDY